MQHVCVDRVNMSKEETDKIFSLFDTDHNNILDPKELVFVMEHIKQSNKEKSNILKFLL